MIKSNKYYKDTKGAKLHPERAEAAAMAADSKRAFKKEHEHFFKSLNQARQFHDEHAYLIQDSSVRGLQEYSESVCEAYIDGKLDRQGVEVCMTFSGLYDIAYDNAEQRGRDAKGRLKSTIDCICDDLDSIAIRKEWEKRKHKIPVSR